MALQEDLGGPMTITAVSWLRSGEGDDWGTYFDLDLYMGIFGSDDLTGTFDDNYIPGTRILVFSTDSLYLEGETGEWVTLDLAQPFVYPGTGNLVIEIQRAGTADNTFLMTYRWHTRTFRTLSAGSPTEPCGYLDRVSSMLKIEYEGVGLEGSTWGGILKLFT